MTEQNPMMMRSEAQSPERSFFELTTIFAVAHDSQVSFDKTPHPDAKRLVSLFIYSQSDRQLANQLDGVYLLERFNVKSGPEGDRWFDLPGGKIENGETVGAAAIREAREELGIEITDMELICQSYAEPTPRYPNGLVKYFIHVKAYEGTPYNALGLDEGHIALSVHGLDDAATKLDTRLCAYSRGQMQAMTPQAAAIPAAPQ